MEFEPIGTVTTIHSSYVWEIEDLHNSSKCKPGVPIISPSFTTQASNSREKRWNMFLFPRGNWEGNEKYISLFVQVECNYNEEQQFRLSILDKQYKKVYGITFFEPMPGSKDYVRWGSNRFIHKNLLVSMAEQLPHDSLTIFCEVIGRYIGAQPVLHKDKLLHTHVGSLLESGLFSDLTVIVEGKNYKTHKNILAARSTTFASWFKDGTIVQDQNVFQLDGVSCRIFDKILRYIYAEKSDFLVNEALDLLKAAFEYGLEDLKFQCEEMLAKNLNIGNVINIHMRAHECKADYLKEFTLNFIILNAREILDVPDFKAMVKKYPHMLEEIYKQTILRQ